MSDSPKQPALAAARRLLRSAVAILLESGVTWKDFAQLGKSVFVEVAMSRFGKSGRPANVSRVSIITGLSRREVMRQRDQLKAGEAPPQGRATHAGRVLSGWYQDADFLGTDGQPRRLCDIGEGMDDDTPGMTELLARYAGDVPDVALLKELIHSGAVRRLRDGRLQALQRYYMPGDLAPDAVLRYGSVTGQLGDTVLYNLTRKPEQPARFEGRASNAQMPAAQAPAFRNMVEQHGEQWLEQVDAWLSEHENDDVDAPGVRLGVGIYLIEEDLDND